MGDQRRRLHPAPDHAPALSAMHGGADAVDRHSDVRFGDETSAADDGVCLDLYEPAGIEEPLDHNEARGRSDPAKGLAVYLRDSVTVSRIHKEHTRSHNVTKRRAGLAKRFVDDLHAPSSLLTDVGVHVAVRPDRSSC
jgi:hypothetical protein